MRNEVLKSMRLHIGIFGKSNVGKSSVLNFITSQNISIVSDISGTTTDPVEKAMELLPIGPVLFVDTAGIDDMSALGEERILKTFSVIDRIDLAIIVCDFNGIDEFENKLIKEFQTRNTPFIILINKSDVKKISEEKLNNIKKITNEFSEVNIKDNSNIDKIKQLIFKNMPDNFFDEERILDDLIKANDVVLQVIPVDKAAPKGRLILPQVRTIRNLLDNGAISIVVRDTELQETMGKLNNSSFKPQLVVTDSQIFKLVDEVIPKDIMLTSYSILFARLKGDLKLFTEGAKAISELKDGDKILIAESCTHHATCEDIGRKKIPNLITKFTGKNLIFDTFSGHNFPDNLDEYSLIIHCGGCMTNKKEIMSRIMHAKSKNISITNYGISIAYCLGIIDRAIQCFNL